MDSKTLVIETTKGTKTYSLAPVRHGYDVYRVQSGFFSSSRKLVGHGSGVENAILMARFDAGDSIVKSTKLRG
jgi:hypothetical protein